MVNIPDRKDDSAAEFARQQAEIAAQVEKKMADRLDRELRELLRKEKGDG